MLGGEMPKSSEEISRLRRLAGEAEQRFLDASEEDQMLSLLAQQISFVASGVSSSKEDVARQQITRSHGPKFAERVLNSPELRKKIGLDRPVTPSAVRATTVAKD
jgi:hypothetical protein